LIFEGLIAHLTHRIISDNIATSPNKKIDVIVGLDARGFLLGPVIALRLGAAFVPVRKRGKLPGECVCATFEKEYGTVRAYSLFFSFFSVLVFVATPMLWWEKKKKVVFASWLIFLVFGNMTGRV
jgi:hypothetical protein